MIQYYLKLISNNFCFISDKKVSLILLFQHFVLQIIEHITASIHLKKLLDKFYLQTHCLIIPQFLNNNNKKWINDVKS